MLSIEIWRRRRLQCCLNLSSCGKASRNSKTVSCSRHLLWHPFLRWFLIHFLCRIGAGDSQTSGCFRLRRGRNQNCRYEGAFMRLLWTVCLAAIRLEWSCSWEETPGITLKISPEWYEKIQGLKFSLVSLWAQNRACLHYVVLSRTGKKVEISSEGVMHCSAGRAGVWATARPVYGPHEAKHRRLRVTARTNLRRQGQHLGHPVMYVPACVIAARLPRKSNARRTTDARSRPKSHQSFFYRRTAERMLPWTRCDLLPRMEPEKEHGIALVWFLTTLLPDEIQEWSTTSWIQFPACISFEETIGLIFTEHAWCDPGNSRKI